LEKFRTAQLELRVREAYEAFYSFKRIAGGDITGTTFDKAEDERRKKWLESVRDKVDFDKVDLTGHSFGAGTMVRAMSLHFNRSADSKLHLLHTPVPDEAYNKLPVGRAVALDPWLEPIPVPTASSPTSNAPETIPPVLIINSPGFTIWDTHFRRLKTMTEKINGTLVSVIGINRTCHDYHFSAEPDETDQSFSDFPLLSPSSPTLALTDLSTIPDLSSSFLEGNLPDSQFIKDLKPDHGDFERKPDGKMEGKRGSIVLHLLGKQM
jgi:platelet-activating factor acetylhydrolase